MYGAFKLGKFIRRFPHAVVLCFVNGLAIVVCICSIWPIESNRSLS
nr:hypothetical protein [Pseudoalteromonas sp. S2893]